MRGGLLIVAALVVMLGVSTVPALAKVSGPCVNCHTMHNSQNGQLVDPDQPNRYLLNQGADPCVACHTGSNSGGGSDTGTTPYVYSTTEPNYGTNTLAGGNFYWVTQDGTKGHNCLAITDMPVDSELTQAPGSPVGQGTFGCADCHDKISTCESCHTPKHHADDSQTVVGASGGFYRFLNSSYHGTDQTGVKGIEDNDWEYTVSATDHNEYAGAVDPANTGGLVSDDFSMSAYCAGCHEAFHGTNYTDDGDGQSPWLRHPTHLALSDTTLGKEYHSYNNGGGYSPLAPIARDQDRLDTMSGPSSLVYVATTDTDGDQVMCLSCHRAHGSPYADMLRWDYDSCDAGSGATNDCGCFVCHTTKDDS